MCVQYVPIPTVLSFKNQKIEVFFFRVNIVKTGINVEGNFFFGRREKTIWLYSDIIHKNYLAYVYCYFLGQFVVPTDTQCMYIMKFQLNSMKSVVKNRKGFDNNWICILLKYRNIVKLLPWDLYYYNFFRLESKVVKIFFRGSRGFLKYITCTKMLKGTLETI